MQWRGRIECFWFDVVNERSCAYSTDVLTARSDDVDNHSWGTHSVFFMETVGVESKLAMKGATKRRHLILVRVIFALPSEVSREYCCIKKESEGHKDNEHKSIICILTIMTGLCNFLACTGDEYTEIHPDITFSVGVNFKMMYSTVS